MFIRKLWEVAWDLWEHRNGIVHEQAVNSGHLRQTLAPTLTGIYTLGSGGLTAF